MTSLADRVRAERLSRDWSIRQAAGAGGISNTWWGRFEDGHQPLTDSIRAAVARAFGWADDWADITPPDAVSVLSERVADLAREVARLAAQVSAQGAELERLRKPRTTRGGAG